MEKILTKEQTKEKALRLLEFRSHSEKELVDKLKRAGSKFEDIKTTVEFLCEYGFLDDRKYATKKAHDLFSLKKYGKMRIREDLKMRGIKNEYIEEALNSIEEDEKENLLPLVEKKLKGNFDKKNIEKAIRYFAMRGYRYEDVKVTIEKIKAEIDF